MHTVSNQVSLTTSRFIYFPVNTESFTTKITKKLVLSMRISKTVLKMMTLFSLAIGFTFSSYANELFTLKNLERERATLISDFLNTNLDVQKKHQRMQQRQRQLADMERMVLRDERLLNTQSTMVEKAFKQYDSTFLVHAGAEKKVNAMNQWLHNINLTNESVLNAKAGYR